MMNRSIVDEILCGLDVNALHLQTYLHDVTLRVCPACSTLHHVFMVSEIAFFALADAQQSELSQITIAICSRLSQRSRP